jgi:hypothetical protein
MCSIRSEGAYHHHPALVFHVERRAWVRRGESGVDGAKMIDRLARDLGYRIIMMTSGPHLLDLLLRGKRIDCVYVTEAQMKILFDDAATVQTIVLGGKKISELKEFGLAHQFVQKNVVTEDGSVISQSFLRYDRKDLQE